MSKKNIKNTLLVLFISLHIIFFQTSAFASLSPVEKQIQNSAIKERDSALALLEQLVNINSETTNLFGIYRVGEVLQNQFKQLGFQTRWIEQPANMHRAGTLLAERKGPPGVRRLLLLAHLDTVLPRNNSSPHFKRYGNLAVGPGVIDNKGGAVVILYALKALQASQALQNTTITVLLTGDTEDIGQPVFLSRKSLFQAAQHADVALDFEASKALDTAVIARRGASHWEIKTVDSLGNNKAVFELARILNDMRTELGEEEYLSFKFDSIKGPIKDGAIVTTAFAKGDLIFFTENQRVNAEEKMQSIVQKNLPGTTAVIRFQDGISAIKPTEQDKNLLKNYSRVSVDLGYGRVKSLHPGMRDPADISYIAGSMPANLSELGPVGTGIHSVKETLEISSLSIAIQRAALLIYRLTHSQES